MSLSYSVSASTSTHFFFLSKSTSPDWPAFSSTWALHLDPSKSKSTRYFYLRNSSCSLLGSVGTAESLCDSKSQCLASRWSCHWWSWHSFALGRSGSESKHYWEKSNSGWGSEMIRAGLTPTENSRSRKSIASATDFWIWCPCSLNFCSAAFSLNSQRFFQMDSSKMNQTVWSTLTGWEFDLTGDTFC